MHVWKHRWSSKSRTTTTQTTGHKPLATNHWYRHTERTRGSGRARNSSMYPAGYTGTTHADSRQCSAEQPKADTTTGKIITAARLLWTSVLNMKHRSRAVAAQHRPVRLDGPEQGPGHTRQHEKQKFFGRTLHCKECATI